MEILALNALSMSTHLLDQQLCTILAAMAFWENDVGRMWDRDALLYYLPQR
jgi:hypothetical protein